MQSVALRSQRPAAVVRQNLCNYRAVIKDINDEYVYALPYEERDSARFSLLIAIAAKSEEPLLYKTIGAVVSPVPDLTCVGNGRDVGLYVSRLAYRRTMTVNEACMLGILAVGSAKEIIDGVGGKSQFAVVSSGGMSPVVPHDINRSEPLALDYQKRALALFFDIGARNLDQAALKKSAIRFGNFALDLNRDWEQQAAPWVDLFNSIAPKP